MRRAVWREWVRDLLIALAVALLLRQGVAEARVVPTASMAPTIQPGDRLLVDKLFFRLTGLRRGDIVVFRPPFPAGEDYIKRVIGLPGETVEVRDGQVWINGAPLAEPYIRARPEYTFGPVTVTPGHILVLGDNRNQSYDSHEWGLLEIAAVKGRAVLRFWPPGRAGAIR